MLLQCSGEARLKMGCSMYDFTKSLVRASLLEKTAAASPSALRCAIFLRLYGDDFDAESREKILRELEVVEQSG
jgi:hypothetical protein